MILLHVLQEVRCRNEAGDVTSKLIRLLTHFTNERALMGLNRGVYSYKCHFYAEHLDMLHKESIERANAHFFCLHFKRRFPCQMSNLCMHKLENTCHGQLLRQNRSMVGFSSKCDAREQTFRSDLARKRKVKARFRKLGEVHVPYTTALCHKRLQIAVRSLLEYRFRAL